MSASEEETEAAVKAMHTRLALMVRSIANLQAPKYIAPAIEQLVRVAVHDTEQLVRKALDPEYEVEPWRKPTPEELAIKQAGNPPVVEDDGLDDLRQSLSQA